MSKADKESTRKLICKPVSPRIVDAKILNRILSNYVQQLIKRMMMSPRRVFPRNASTSEKQCSY